MIQWKSLDDKYKYQRFKSEEGKRAETSSLLYNFKDVMKEQYPEAIVLHMDEIPKTMRAQLFNPNCVVDLKEVVRNFKEANRGSLEIGQDMSIFVPSSSKTRFYHHGKFYAMVPGEIKTNPTDEQLKSTCIEYLTNWKLDKDRWGSVTPHVHLLTIKVDTHTLDGRLIPLDVYNRLQAAEVSQKMRADMNLKVTTLPFRFQHPDKVLVSEGIQPPTKKLDDLAHPRAWIDKAATQIRERLISNERQVIGVTSHIGTGKTALIATVCKMGLRCMALSIAVFPTIEIARCCVEKYDNGGDLQEINHEVSDIRQQWSKIESKALETNEKITPCCICMATLKRETNRIVNIAQKLECVGQRIGIVIDEAHKCNDVSTMERLLSQPNIIIILVTATGPETWKTFSNPQWGLRWKEVDADALTEDQMHRLTSKSLASHIDFTGSTAGNFCDAIPDDIKLSKLNANAVVESDARLFQSVPLDVSRHFKELIWIKGLSAKEAVNQNISMRFKFRMVGCEKGKRQEGLVKFMCLESNAKNALILTLNEKEAKRLAELLPQYTTPERRVFVERYYGNDKHHHQFDDLCKQNLASDGGVGLVVIIAIKKLDVGADLPMVDTVLLDQSLKTSSNITDCQKLLQLCRQTRMYIGKYDAELIMEETHTNIKALSHFVEHYDSRFEISSIFRFAGKKERSNSFEDLIAWSVPDDGIKADINDMIHKRKKTCMTIEKVYEHFMKRFAKFQPKRGDVLVVNGVELSATEWMTKIVSYLRERWVGIDDKTKNEVQKVVWVWEKTMKPSPPEHITLPDKPPNGYEGWLKTEAPPDRITIDVMVPFLEEITAELSSGRKEKLESLLDDNPSHKIKIKEKHRRTKDEMEEDEMEEDEMEEDDLSIQIVDLTTTKGGLRLNSNIFKMCKEVKEKIGNRETGNGSTPAAANKLLVYQLLKMPNSGKDDTWLTRRKHEVQTYRQTKHKHDLFFKTLLNKQTNKRERETDMLPAENRNIKDYFQYKWNNPFI